ncbi:hypothetical protein ACTA71_011226 [Dictyostelium dimigraforme]
MSKINNFYLLLICFLFISGIKSYFKVTQHGIKCGTSLETSCNNIKEAINYYRYYANLPENQNADDYFLFINIVDGTYPAEDNYIEFEGWNVVIDRYGSPNTNITIDGGGLTKPFININNVATNEKTSLLMINNINFVNFNGEFNSFNSIFGNMGIQVLLSFCNFLNSGQSQGLYFTGKAIPPEGIYSIVNGIFAFYTCNFENIIFKNNTFNFNYSYVGIEFSEMKSITVEGSLYNDKLGSNDLSIYNTTFNGINFNGGDNLFIIKSGRFNIGLSRFYNIKSSSTNNYFISTFNNTSFSLKDSESYYNIFSNNFTDFNCNFLNDSQGTIRFNENIISSSQSNIKVFNLINSNITLTNNNINYPNANGLVYCKNSIITIIDDQSESLTIHPICSTCNFVYNGDEICNNDTTNGSNSGETPISSSEHTISSETTISSESKASSSESESTISSENKTSSETTTTTTQSSHINSSNNSVSIPYTLISILFILTTLIYF